MEATRLVALAKGLAEQLQCVDQITFHKGSSLEFMRSTKQRYDLIFLDSDHRADTVYQEVSAALPLLSSNGVLLLHDYYPGGVPLFPNSAVIGPFYAFHYKLGDRYKMKSNTCRYSGTRSFMPVHGVSLALSFL
jgi:predicted O-methyltransferase YrrM